MDQRGPDDPESAGLLDPGGRRARRGGPDRFDSFDRFDRSDRFGRFGNRHGLGGFDSFNNRHRPEGHGDGWAWGAPGLASRNQKTAHNHELTVHGAPGKNP